MGSCVTRNRVRKRAQRATRGLLSASVQAAVLEVLHCRGSANIEDLVQALPSYAWRQVFSAVDVLRMKAVLTVARPDESTYYISLRRAAHS